MMEDFIMAPNNKAVLDQIDAILKKVEGYEKGAGPKGDQTFEEQMVTLMGSAIERFAPKESAYLEQVKKAQKLHARASIWNYIAILKVLRTAYSEGFMQSVIEVIHADLFADFLEMADHLVTQGYKDASAVLAGGVLEEHLRKLC